jgi:hypothetical protein
MKKTLLAVSVAVLMLSQVAYADEATHRQLAENLLISMHVDKNLPVIRQILVNAILTPLVEGQMKTEPAEAQLLIQKISDLFAQEFTWEKLKPDYTSLYAEMFTEEELRALTAFFNTPIGKKYVEKSPELARKSMEIGQRKGMELGNKIEEELKSMKQK